ncbi:MAG: hypothetical protein ATN35_07660 [Epulopiscium sp. Nele67-Bin004]|nr:MAG: hypothetical protein ATN35_07660 [Epulopiscium sp. Nele67-Bin004]
MQQRIVSEHIFLFPFAWSISTQKQGYYFRPQYQIKHKIFQNIKGWESEEFKIETDEQYNEFVYFYRPVRNALYSDSEYENISNNYNLIDVGSDSNCVIDIKGKSYTLNIKRIGLKIVKSGIGILSFYLQNTTYLEQEDVHNINMFTDCVYPLELPLNDRESRIYPTKIRFELNSSIIEEDILQTEYKKIAGKISPFIMSILGDSFSQDSAKHRRILVEPLIGSKMFCICLYKDDQAFSQVQMSKKYNFKKEYTLIEDEQCYFLSPFVLFSISKTNTSSRVYDQMMSLLVIQKASLLNFSNQIATISLLSKEELVVAIQSIYEIYIQFINQMFFDEITEDEKGTWIYQRNSKLFHIRDEIAQLDFEMKEVHEYAELITRQQSNRRMEAVTIMGAGLVLPTFVTGFFGMNVLTEELGRWWEHADVLKWLNTYVIFPILALLYMYTWKRTKNRIFIFIRIGMTIALVVSCLIIVKYGSGV